jgi:hypothetical protein
MGWRLFGTQRHSGWEGDVAIPLTQPTSVGVSSATAVFRIEKIGSFVAYEAHGSVLTDVYLRAHSWFAKVYGGEWGIRTPDRAFAL